MARTFKFFFNNFWTFWLICISVLSSRQIKSLIKIVTRQFFSAKIQIIFLSNFWTFWLICISVLSSRQISSEWNANVNSNYEISTWHHLDHWKTSSKILLGSLEKCAKSSWDASQVCQSKLDDIKLSLSCMTMERFWEVDRFISTLVQVLLLKGNEKLTIYFPNSKL